jgi:hypothetical protein
MKFLDTGARHRRAFYDGQQRLGDIQQSDGGYVARDRQGKALGLFDTAHEAIEIVLKAGGAP